jgi:hypothetical protein
MWPSVRGSSLGAERHHVIRAMRGAVVALRRPTQCPTVMSASRWQSCDDAFFVLRRGTLFRGVRGRLVGSLHHGAACAPLCLRGPLRARGLSMCAYACCCTALCYMVLRARRPAAVLLGARRCAAPAARLCVCDRLVSYVVAQFISGVLCRSLHLPKRAPFLNFRLNLCA